MKKYLAIFFTAVISFVYSFSYSQTDSSLIIKTVLDYGEGYYSGNPGRMESAIHPDLNKVMPEKIGENGNTVLRNSTYSGLIELCRNKFGVLDESKRKISVTLIKIEGDMAFARLNSAKFNDYIQLGKIAGNWKIINVLWTYGSDVKRNKVLSEDETGKVREAVKDAVTGFYEGLYTGNPELVDNFLHGECCLDVLFRLPGSEDYMVSKDSFGTLREVAVQKLALLDREKWNFTVTVLDVMDGLAAVEVVSANVTTFIQAADFGGTWKIVNSLRTPAKVN